MSDDMGWSVLKRVFHESDWSFSEDLLMHCYRIARETQFDEEREVAIRRMREAVEKYVEQSLGGGGK